MEVGIVEALLGIIGALNLLALGWLHMRQNALSAEVDRLDDEKVSHKIYDETREDLKTLIKLVGDLRVDLARWEGRTETQEKNSASI